SECCSRQRGAARVTVWVRGGRGGWRGDPLSPTDAYVRVVLGQRHARTATVWNNQWPNWGERLDLGWVVLPAAPRLRVEVWDEDNGWDDDLLGGCEEPLRVGGRHLVCYAGGGRLEWGYRLSCGPALGGPLCEDYVPNPPKNFGGISRFTHWPPG
ncbi:PERF protein, partial [Pterocles burchelli]|nr:PERF protein [Pterocles burchelli]